MRNRTQGFTLIELLIVIAIIGILAAVLIPNLLNARQRAFDTATASCLKEIATLEESNAIVPPYTYVSNVSIAATANACDNVVLTSTGSTTAFAYTGSHPSGTGRVYSVSAGSGVE